MQLLRPGQGTGRRNLRSVPQIGGAATRPPLPAAAVEYWHQAFGVEPVVSSGVVYANSWTGQKRGIVCTAPSAGLRTLYAPDGSYFGGRPVIQASGGRCLLKSAISPAVFLAGTNPYALVVYRTPVAGTSSEWICGLNGPVQANAPAIVPAPGFQVTTYWSGAYNVTRSGVSAVPIVLDTWMPASTPTKSSVNGSPFTSAGSVYAALGGAAVNMGIGASPDGSAASSANIAFIYLGSSRPSDAERDALLDWCFAEFSLPVSPATILKTKYVLDLDGDVGVSLLTSKVTGWEDQASQNSPAQGTVARRPTIGTPLNGHVGIFCFAGSTQWLALASAFSGIVAGDKPRIYFVMDMMVLASCGAFELTDSVASNRIMGISANGGFASATAVLGGSAVSAYGTIATTTGAKRYEAIVNAADQPEVRMNDASGVTSATAGGLTRTPTRMTIGILGDAATWPASITAYRILIANPAPSSAEHDRIVNYLRTRYAIA